jgi:uncharacterized membrane protein
MFLSVDRVRRAHALCVTHCFYPLALCSLLSLAFLATRLYVLDTPGYRFLVWNLFLAWMPWGSAVAVALVCVAGRRETPRERRRFTIVVALLGACWLLTFPNAPYILTDVVHLVRNPVRRWWFDAGLVMSFALTGCFLAVASLRLMHELVRDAAGRFVGWVFVLIVSGLSGFGIYLGRFGRFNSWDVLAEPARLARAVARPLLNPLDHPRAVGMTLMFAALLLACYVVFTSIQTRETQLRPLE